MGHGKRVPRNPVVAHQEPAGEALLEGVIPVRDGGVGGLEMCHVGVEAQAAPQRVVRLDQPQESHALHPEGFALDLHEGFVRRPVDIEEEGHADETLPAREVHLDPPAPRGGGHLRDDTGFEEVDMGDRLAGGDEHVAPCQGDRLGHRTDGLVIPQIQCAQKRIPNKSL